MRNISLLVLLLCTLGFQAQSQEVPGIKIDEVLAEMNKEDGTTRVLNLWATWCAPCVKELPHFEEIAQEYKDKNVKFIFLAVEDEVAKVARFVQLKNIQSEVYILEDTDANYWIPKVNADWQGELPVTRFVNASQEKDIFHSGDLSKEELLNLVNKFVN